jgi:hypothetical protein
MDSFLLTSHTTKNVGADNNQTPTQWQQRFGCDGGEQYGIRNCLASKAQISLDKELKASGFLQDDSSSNMDNCTTSHDRNQNTQLCTESSCCRGKGQRTSAPPAGGAEEEVAGKLEQPFRNVPKGESCCFSISWALFAVSSC